MRLLATSLSILFFTLLTVAQPYSIYQNITTSNGLPSNYVFAVCEDDNGFLWAGTDKGLCRFDGFRWQLWDKDNGLPGNYVNTVLSDKHGGLWIGISDKGYYHFDKTGKVLPLSLPGRVSPYSVQTDNSGNLYLETSVGGSGMVQAYLFNAASLNKPQLIYQQSPQHPFRIKADAASGKIYCGVPHLETFRKNNTVLQSKWPVVPVVLPANIYSAGAIYYLGDSMAITNNDCFKLTPNKIWTQQTLFPNPNNYAQYCFTPEGLYVYDIKTGYYFLSNNGEKTFYSSVSGLGTDYVNQIYRARDGSIIISTLGAGLQLQKNNYRKTFSTNNKLVRTILSYSDSWYFLAGDEIFKANSKEKGLTSLGTAGKSTLHLYKTNDTLLVGSLKGISFFKEHNSSLAYINFLDCNPGVSSIIKTEQGFMAGTYGSGMAYFTTRMLQLQSSNFPFKIVEKIVPLAKGYAALSYEDGLIINDEESGLKHITHKDGLLSNSVYSVYQVGDSLWIGTKGGLNLYTKGKILATYPFPPGLNDAKAIAVFKDRNKKVWAVSNKHLYQLTGQQLKPVGSHPLVSDDDMVTAAVFNEARQEIAVGSNKAFATISLPQVVPNSSVTAPQLVDVFVDEKSQPHGSLLQVPYQFASLAFVLAPLSTSPFSQSRFYYQLRGRDDTWHEVKDSLIISFSVLRPGDYQLLAKTINADGYESDEKELVAFFILKPFWQRWPFLTLCFIATAFITTLIVKQVEKAARRKKLATLLLKQSLQVERERISKDLHDHLGANLATIIAQTDHIEARLYKGDIEKAAITVQHLSAQSRETMNVLRETIWAVQEAEHTLHDFVMRIRNFLQRSFESTSIQWEVSQQLNENLLLSPTQTLHLFRIIQEATQNILKHAGASKALYVFSKKGTDLVISITDDGRGFIYKNGAETNGLINMKERVSQLKGTVHIAGSKGTKVEINIPCNAAVEDIL